MQKALPLYLSYQYCANVITIYKFEELCESVKKIDSTQAFVSMLGVASCLQWNGMASASRVLHICSAQDEHHELITMLHTD